MLGWHIHFLFDINGYRVHYRHSDWTDLEQKYPSFCLIFTYYGGVKTTKKVQSIYRTYISHFDEILQCKDVAVSKLCCKQKKHEVDLRCTHCVLLLRVLKTKNRQRFSLVDGTPKRVVIGGKDHMHDMTIYHVSGRRGGPI